MSAAIRVDAASGVEERLEHVASSSGLVYTYVARPPGAHRCVVICSSVLADFHANYHRERLLGRALASSGFGVIRFHYTGQGNSIGDRRHMTLKTMCDDTDAILDLGADMGFREFGLVGTRLGALVAARTASRFESAPLVLWEPVADPIRFVREGQRAKRMSQLVQSDTQESADWRNQLTSGEQVDLFGYTVYPQLIDSFSGSSLETELGSHPRPVLLVRFRTRDIPLERLSSELTAKGFDVESRTFGLPESWWLPSEDVLESEDLIKGTSDWLESILGPPRERNL